MMGKKTRRGTRSTSSGTSRATCGWRDGGDADDVCARTKPGSASLPEAERTVATVSTPTTGRQKSIRSDFSPSKPIRSKISAKLPATDSPGSVLDVGHVFSASDSVPSVPIADENPEFDMTAYLAELELFLDDMEHDMEREREGQLRTDGCAPLASISTSNTSASVSTQIVAPTVSSEHGALSPTNSGTSAGLPVHGSLRQGLHTADCHTFDCGISTDNSKPDLSSRPIGAADASVQTERGHAVSPANALSLIHSEGVNSILLASSIIHQAAYTIQKFTKHSIAKLPAFKAKAALLLTELKVAFADTANWRSALSLNGFDPDCGNDCSDSIYGPPHNIYEQRPVPPFGHVKEVLSRAYPTDEQRHVIYMRHLEDHYTQYPILYRDAAYANKSRPIEYRLRVLKLHLHDKKERDLERERELALTRSRRMFTSLPPPPSVPSLGASPAFLDVFSSSSDNHIQPSPPTPTISSGTSFMRSTQLTRAVFNAAEQELLAIGFEHFEPARAATLASGPNRDHAEPEYNHEGYRDHDPFIVNTQRTLIRDDHGSKFLAAEQSSAIRSSMAHAFEQPAPYDSSPLVNALAASSDDEHDTRDDRAQDHSDTHSDSRSRHSDDDANAHFTTADY